MTVGGSGEVGSETKLGEPKAKDQLPAVSIRSVYPKVTGPAQDETEIMRKNAVNNVFIWRLMLFFPGSCDRVKVVRANSIPPK